MGVFGFIVPLVVSASLAAAAVASSVPKPAVPEAKNLLASIPLRFEPAQPASDGSTQFTARAPGFRALLTPGEILLHLPGAELGMKLSGANSSPRLEGAGELSAKSTYLLGNNKDKWRIGVPQYKGVQYKGVYRGIDMMVYGADEGLEYDFVLQPGANPETIRMQFRNATGLTLTREGHLRLLTGERDLVQKKPVAFQELRSGVRRSVEASYVLLGANTAGIRVGRYDRSLPLVIDPVIAYSSYLGGQAADTIMAVGVDSAGIVYVAGNTTSGDLPTSEDYSMRDTPAGRRDIFVAKINPAATGLDSLINVTYLGGALNDNVTSMAVHPSGRVYLAGATRSPDFPMAGSSYQTASSGDATKDDGFVAVLDFGGAALAYSTYLGGKESDIVNSIAIDSAGMIYAAGNTRSEEFPVTAESLQGVRWSDQDGFVTKLNPFAEDGPSSLVYSTFWGGDFIDEVRGIAVSPDGGRVYVTGTTYSTQFQVTGNAIISEYRGAGDGFLTVLDLNKANWDALIYSTFLGGGAIDEPRAIALDGRGGVLLAGYTHSADFPVTENAFQPEPRRAGNAWVARIEPGTGLTYSTFLGGTGGETPYGIAPDGNGNLYVVGYTLSGDFPVTDNALQPNHSGLTDAFCTVLSPSGSRGQGLIYSSFINGGGGNTIAYGLAVANGRAYVAGQTQSRQFPVSEGAAYGSFRGGLSDGFVYVLIP